jgi:hypothetical protein
MIHFILIALMLLPSSELPLSTNPCPDLSFLTTFSLASWQLEKIPGGNFFPTFFENLAPTTTFLIEESNGFALFDPPRVYFEGDSFLQFSWSINQLAASSALIPGTPGVIPPLGTIAKFELSRQSPLSWLQGMNFCLKNPYEKPSPQPLKITLSHVWPNMKGMIPGATFMLQPHSTTTERNLLLYSSRRQFVQNNFVDFVYTYNSNSLGAVFGATYFRTQRRFNDFNQPEATFEEPGELILLSTRIKKDFNRLKVNFVTIFNHLSRDNFTAELGRLPQETLLLRRRALFSGVNLATSRLRINLSLLFENNNTTPQTINFSKELLDNDGEGFFPFARWGEFTAKTFRLNLSYPFSFNQDQPFHLQLYSDLKYSLLAGHESTHQFNPLYFHGQPYQVIHWKEGGRFQNSNSSLRGGLLGQWLVGKNLSLSLKLFMQASFLRFSDEGANLKFIQPGFDLGLSLFPRHRHQLFLAYGLIPWEIRENLNYFLERNRPLGEIYYWSDANHDGLFQKGEEDRLYRLTGGPVHSAASDLTPPVNQRLLVVLHSSLSTSFSLQLQGMIKEVQNNFWVIFREKYGHYISVDDKSLYLLDQPMTYFLLSNYPFSEKPFSAELTLHIFGQKEEKWYFSFSFMAHLGMGYTSFGNGPTANDIGIIDESQASPNTWINGYGRVDGDRAFVGKMFFGFYLFPRFFLSATLKYRDGHPFAFIDTYQIGEERIFVLQTIQAENKKGIKGGPREDYLSDISLKLTYSLPLKKARIDLYASLFNAFDFGSELSEYVFSGGKRYALELQIPRSLRVGLKLSW